MTKNILYVKKIDSNKIIFSSDQTENWFLYLIFGLKMKKKKKNEIK